MSVIAPERLLAMYAEGLFPMADGRKGPVFVYSPDPRTIMPLDAFHISHSLGKTWRSGRFQIFIDRSFETVIRACAARPETWLSEGLIRSYIRLHQLSHAHSVEIWMENELAGGLYGVSIGGAFFGESMFHFKRDASKLSLVALVSQMRERGLGLLDVQYNTPHLQCFGAVEISREHYLRLLKEELSKPLTFYDPDYGINEVLFSTR